METRFCFLLLDRLNDMTTFSTRLIKVLTVLCLAGSMSACSWFGLSKKHKAPPLGAEVEQEESTTAQGPATASANQTGDSSQQPVIEPQVERRHIKTPKIGSQDFEIGAKFGVINIEDFGSSSVFGATLTYHLSEDFFLEGTYGRAKGGKTSVEELYNIQLLTEKERQYSYYALNAGWNALPGEVFIGKNRAYNSAFYVDAGMGWTDFAGDNRFTVNAGLGYRLLVTSWVAVHFDFRDYLYDIDTFGVKKVAHNLEGTLGLAVFF
jgi:outer membrane beta-barrel protein